MDRKFFENVFSAKRLEKYFERYSNDTENAITHYRCNIELSEAFYPCISTFEIAFRNAVSRELSVLFGREDWYSTFAATPGLMNLNKYISQANKQIAGRKEYASPPKIIAELTLGFWVSLFNVEYERILWKDLRRVFPNVPKQERQRKNVAPPLNHFRIFRNRVFHHEPIAWNLKKISQIHTEILIVMGWMNKDIPIWLEPFDRFNIVFQKVKKELNT
ncbi:MAG: Abi family protein [Flavobacteriaceae bacterium]|nr:Abi family protein [Flavobacteriaceae bacterium]